MRNSNLRVLALVIVLVGVLLRSSTASDEIHDVVIYGGTSAAVTAAVQTKRMGKTAIIVCPEKHIGGLTSGGLGWTDSGNKAAIGGLSREFYHRVWQHYQRPEAWRWQKRSEYGTRHESPPRKPGDVAAMWVFEPHVAERIFEQLLGEYQIPVERDQWLDRAAGRGVHRVGGRIESITMLSGKSYRGRMFVDATYEGDLLAAAGVDYHVGREANSVYGETWNGIQVGTLHHGHWFKKPVDPYVEPGKPSSGLLPRISDRPPGKKGDGDRRIQAYCFRMCLTDLEANRIPFPRPDGYDPAQYELLLRVFDTGWRETFQKFDRIPNRKTDTNNHGPFSTDNIGRNYDYPEASYERRKEIIHEHEVYQKGLMYFVANDPRVPDDVRTAMAKWGLAKDEFVDNGGWPHQIYVREARRMIGQYVMTEHDCLDRVETPQSIGMGSYTIDSHNVQRYVTPDGHVQNEGDIGVRTPRPYEIAYGAIVPKKAQCVNFFSPVCVSASHIAYGSIRMEPVFMILGQSAATAACLALDRGVAVQDLPYEVLRTRLLQDGQVLELHNPNAILSRKLPGVVIDDRDAKLTGTWAQSSAIPKYVDGGYRHNASERPGQKQAVFETRLTPGRYKVLVSYSANGNRATNVPVTIYSTSGRTTRTINQRTTPPVDGLFVSLGEYDFAARAKVVIGTQNTDGCVIIDAVQFLPVDTK